MIEEIEKMKLKNKNPYPSESEYQRKSVMAEETTNSLLNFDIEVNIWTHLKANNKLNLQLCN